MNGGTHIISFRTREAHDTRLASGTRRARGTWTTTFSLTSLMKKKNYIKKIWYRYEQLFSVAKYVSTCYLISLSFWDIWKIHTGGPGFPSLPGPPGLPGIPWIKEVSSQVTQNKNIQNYNLCYLYNLKIATYMHSLIFSCFFPVKHFSQVIYFLFFPSTLIKFS